MNCSYQFTSHHFMNNIREVHLKYSYLFTKKQAAFFYNKQNCFCDTLGSSFVKKKALTKTSNEWNCNRIFNYPLLIRVPFTVMLTEFLHAYVSAHNLIWLFFKSRLLTFLTDKVTQNLSVLPVNCLNRFTNHHFMNNIRDVRLNYIYWYPKKQTNFLTRKQNCFCDATGSSFVNKGHLQKWARNEMIILSLKR